MSIQRKISKKSGKFNIKFCDPLLTSESMADVVSELYGIPVGVSSAGLFVEVDV